MKKLLDDVRAFHEMTGLPVLATPQVPGPERVELRVSLLEEETREFREAARKGDLVGMADALADVVYVAVGAALELGIPLEAVWDEVQRSNMAKRDPLTGRVRRREDGKILKPDGWTPPDVAAAMGLRGHLEAGPCCG
jgi:predicted HAD superfamily Cof-like phosphohydrolase